MSFGTRVAHERLTAIGGCEDGRRKASQRAGGSAAGYTDDSADAAPARSAAQRGNRARSCWQSAAVLRPVPESAAAVLLHSGAEELSRLAAANGLGKNPSEPWNSPDLARIPQ